MKRILLLLTLIPVLALADAVIFSGNDVKALKPNLDLFGAAKILTTSSDPSSGGGLSAPIGSIALNVVTGETYSKTGAGNTAWVKKQNYPVGLTTDVTGILPVANGGTGSATQNFVDLTSDQTVGGNKTFSSSIVADITGNASTVTTNANLSGDITSVGNTTSYNGTVPISKGGTGSTSQNFVDLTTAQNVAGVKTFSDTIQGNISGNASTVTTNANLTGPITSVGNTTSVASQTGTGSKFVMDTSPTISAPTISGHPTIEGVTATGATGTGKIVYDTSPTLVTPNIGAATGSSLTTSGNISASGTVLGSNLSGTNTGDLLSRSDKDVADVTTAKLTAPYGQLSTSAAGIRNIDTGNTNILSNSSFRVGGGTVSSVPNWTLTTADADDDGTYLTITPTLSGGGLKQTVTTNAAYLAGGQGAVYANVKTLGTDVYVCPLMNGSRPSDITKYCGKVPVTTTAVPFPQVIVPFIMDGTSNGIEIYSTGTSPFQFRKTVPVFAGQSAPFQSVNGAKLVDTITVTGCASAWSTTATSAWGTFGTQTGCTYSSSKGICTGPNGTNSSQTAGPAFKCSYLAAGDYRIEYEGQLYNSGSASNSFYSFTDGTNRTREITTFATGTGGGGPSSLNQTISYSTSQSNVTLTAQAYAASAVTTYIYGTTATPGTFKVWYFPPESKIYSQTYYGAESIEALSSTTTYGSTNTGVPVLTISSNTNNGVLTVNSDSTNGTSFTANVTAEIKVTAQVVGTVNGASFFVTKNATTLTSTIPDGIKTVAVSYTNAPRATLNSVFKVVKGDIVRIQKSDSGTNTIAYVNIVATPTDNPITGSFAGIEKCANDYECTSEFSATISSAGVVSNQNVPWINGNCNNSATGQWDCTLLTYLKDGTSGLSSPLKCNVNSDDRNNIGAYSGTTSTATFTLANRTSGATNGTNIYVSCQKGTNDYKPKTAKIADPAALIPAVSPVSTTNIDWSLIKVATGLYTKTLSANTTFTFSNLTAGQAINVRLTNTASNYTVTWPTVKWPGGTAPVMTTGAKSDIYSFFYDGTDIYGTYVQDY